VPGGLTPTRTDEQEQAIAAAADTAGERLDPQDDIDPAAYPHIHRLARHLAEEHFDEEFEAGLTDMLDRVAARVG
jgi:hypothetical protein